MRFSVCLCFCYKQDTAYEMLISDWSSDVCSSDLACFVTQATLSAGIRELETLIGITLVERTRRVVRFTPLGDRIAAKARRVIREAEELGDLARAAGRPLSGEMRMRSEEHTSELQSLMRISYAVFCLKQKTHELTYMIINSTTTVK